MTFLFFNDGIINAFSSNISYCVIVTVKMRKNKLSQFYGEELKLFPHWKVCLCV